MKIRKTKYGKFYKEWVRLYKEGKSIMAIANEYSCSDTNIRRVLVKYNVKINSYYRGYETK